MSLTKQDLQEHKCRCGKGKVEQPTQLAINAEVARIERERILTLLGGFQNPAWRNYYLQAITDLVNK